MHARRPNAPDWTDVNESDPGITLLQLFGFLGESLAYVAQRRKLAVAALVLVALWKIRADRAQ
jgi:hypothetical protein